LPRTPGNTVQIRVFIPPEAYDKMLQEAKQKGTTISGLTRMIILERYVEKTK